MNKEKILERYNLEDSIHYSAHLEIAEDSSRDYIDRIVAFSKHWKMNEKDIINHHKKNKIHMICEYLFDYSSIFTPIEAAAWNAIRCIGQIPLYPQYPILNFIADFGNPYYKIAVELDGKEFHDFKKDFSRDRSIEKIGWTVFRITGSDMLRMPKYDYYEILEEYNYKNIDEDEMQDMMEDFFNTGWGFFFALRMFYINKSFDFDSEIGHIIYKCAIGSISNRVTAGEIKI